MSGKLKLPAWALLVVFIASLVMHTGGRAAATGWVQRLGGADRYETAALVAREKYYYSDVVILARGDVFADGLAASTLAGALDAPVLLTRPDELPYVTSQAITKLQAYHAIILGGTGAISRKVEDALLNKGLTVERIGGSNRYDTAARIARRAGQAAALPSFAFIVNGYAAADSLTAGAAAFLNKAPVLQVTATGIPPETREALRDLGITGVYIVGGTGVISAGVQSELARMVTVKGRLSGSDRYATGVAMAKEFFPDSGNVWLARGDDACLADAIGAAVFGEPLLYVRQGDIPAAVSGYLDEMLTGDSRVGIIGGVGVVWPAVENAIEVKMLGEETSRLSIAKLDNLILSPKEAKDVEVKVTPVQAKITAKSSDTKVVRITRVENNIVKLSAQSNAKGVATITVTATHEDQSVERTFEVTVTDDKVTLSCPSTVEVKEGYNSSFTVEINTGKLSVKSDVTAVASVVSVSGSGTTRTVTIRGVSPGTAELTLTGTQDLYHPAEAKVKVIVPGAPILNPGGKTITGSVDDDIEIPFYDSPDWRSKIDLVVVNNIKDNNSNTLEKDVHYRVEAGKIILMPGADPPTDYFGTWELRTPGTKTIVVRATTAYPDRQVNIVINAGEVAALEVTRQPEPPTASGRYFVTQPIVTLRDQYGNVCSTGVSRSAPVKAEPRMGDDGSVIWRIGGSYTTRNASGGVVGFSGLTCTTISQTATMGSITFTTGTISVDSIPFILP